MTEKRSAVLERSAVVGAVQWTLTCLDRYGVTSNVLRAVAALRSAIYASAIARCSRTAGRWTRDALVYEWLTTSPEPDAATIDLRDSHAVGPFRSRISPNVIQSSEILTLVRETRAYVLANPVRAGAIVVASALVTFAVTKSTGSSIALVGLLFALLAAIIGGRTDAEACSDNSWTIRVLRAILTPSGTTEEDE